MIVTGKALPLQRSIVHNEFLVAQLCYNMDKSPEKNMDKSSILGLLMAKKISTAVPTTDLYILAFKKKEKETNLFIE